MTASLLTPSRKNGGPSCCAKHRSGVYEADDAKSHDYNGSLPQHLFHEVLLPHLKAGGRATILAEEWQTRYRSSRSVASRPKARVKRCWRRLEHGIRELA